MGSCIKLLYKNKYEFTINANSIEEALFKVLISYTGFNVRPIDNEIKQEIVSRNLKKQYFKIISNTVSCTDYLKLHDSFNSK